MLDMNAFNKIFKLPGGDQVNEQGKPRKVSKERKDAVKFAVKSIGVALVSEIMAHSGLKEDTVGRSLYWLKKSKDVKECSTVMIGKRKTPQYSAT